MRKSVFKLWGGGGITFQRIRGVVNCNTSLLYITAHTDRGVQGHHLTEKILHFIYKYIFLLTHNDLTILGQSQRYNMCVS